MAGEATGIPSVRFSTGLVSIAGNVLSNAVSVAAAANHSLALRDDGTVVGWGYNAEGQATGSKSPRPYTSNGLVTFNASIVSNVMAIAAGRGYSVGLIRDGTVVTCGEINLPVGINKVAAVAAGRGHFLVLKHDSTVSSMGAANRPPTGIRNVVAIAATSEGHGNDLALLGDGKVVQWGVRGIEEQIPMPPQLNSIVAIAAGASHYLALKRDGTVFGWGFDGSGAATGILATNLPYMSSGLVMLNGKLLSDISAIAAGNGYSLALRRDSTVVAWGHPPRWTMGTWPVPSGLSNVVAIAAGETFCLAITTNAAVAERFRH